MASKYERDTGRKIALPSKLGVILNDPSVKGEDPLVQQEDEKFDENIRKGRIAAETLLKPLTFFEAVEALNLPKMEENDGKKQNKNKKPKEISSFETHHLITKIDLSGFKNLRFSRAGL